VSSEKRVLGQKEAGELLESLRWQEDMLITNSDGERVWLKPLYDRTTGKRLGITDCCPENAPCERHQKMVQKN
jgi:hypothetical protein